MIRKQAGDEIANIFSKLISKKNISKTASEKNDISDCGYAHDKDLSSMAADMVLSENDEVRHSSMDEIDDAKNHLHHEVKDPKMASLMSGLGKIAASLRSEGENFAADVVEATAISISKDNVKKASKTASVVNELKKISSELRAEDRFASDLVDSTIKKIVS